MNVLVFTSLYPSNVWPNHGIFIHERMSRVARLPGVHLRVLAPVPYYPPFLPGSRAAYRRVASRETRDGVDVLHPRYVMVPKIGMSVHGRLLYASALPAVRALQSEFDFDVIDAHYVYPDGFAAVLLGRELGRPVVVSARGSDINRFQTFPRIRPRLEQTLRGAAAVIAVSRALAQSMARLGIPEETIHVIPNGVDLVRYRIAPKLEARARLGLPEVRILLYVGHLVPGKGLDVLMGAFARVLSSRGRESCRLVLVGRGPLRGRIEQQARALGISDRVSFAGEIPHAALSDWYSAADVLCLASEREGWPNVILESLACGTPVVATRVGGIPEIIASDAVGVLAENSEDAFAAAILRALERNWDAQALRAHAERYTWERSAQSVGRVLAGAAGSVKVPRDVPISMGGASGTP